MNIKPAQGQTITPIFTVHAALSFNGVDWFPIQPFNKTGDSIPEMAQRLESRINFLREHRDIEIKILKIEDGPVAEGINEKHRQDIAKALYSKFLCELSA